MLFCLYFYVFRQHQPIMLKYIHIYNKEEIKHFSFESHNKQQKTLHKGALVFTFRCTLHTID